MIKIPLTPRLFVEECIRICIPRYLRNCVVNTRTESVFKHACNRAITWNSDDETNVPWSVARAMMIKGLWNTRLMRDSWPSPLTPSSSSSWCKVIMPNRRWTTQQVRNAFFMNESLTLLNDTLTNYFFQVFWKRICFINFKVSSSRIFHSVSTWLCWI